MLTSEDVQKLKEVLATKEDLNNLSVKLLPRGEFESFRIELKEDIDGLREMVQALVISVDKLVGAVGALSQGYRWSLIKLIATKNGFYKLPRSLELNCNIKNKTKNSGF